MESQGSIAYLWENKIIMILTSKFGKRLENHDVAATLIPGRKADVEKLAKKAIEPCGANLTSRLFRLTLSTK